MGADVENVAHHVYVMPSGKSVTLYVIDTARLSRSMSLSLISDFNNFDK